MKNSKFAAGLALALSSSAWAIQPPHAVPSPSSPPRPGAAPSASATPVATSDYALIFNPGLSKTLATSLSLGQKEQRTSGNCTLSGASDGPIVCITEDSCAPGDGMSIPSCMVLFNAPTGLNLTDVVTLSPATRETGTPSPTTSPGVTGGTSLLGRVIETLKAR